MACTPFRTGCQLPLLVRDRNGQLQLTDTRHSFLHCTLMLAWHVHSQICSTCRESGLRCDGVRYQSAAGRGRSEAVGSGRHLPEGEEHGRLDQRKLEHREKV